MKTYAVEFSGEILYAAKWSDDELKHRIGEVALACAVSGGTPWKVIDWEAQKVIAQSDVDGFWVR